MPDLRTPIQLQRELRNCRKAIRMLKKAEWMVTCDWTTNDEREKLWREVAKLARVRF
jgi:hypothetical protein